MATNDEIVALTDEAFMEMRALERALADMLESVQLRRVWCDFGEDGANILDLAESVNEAMEAANNAATDANIPIHVMWDAARQREAAIARGDSA